MYKHITLFDKILEELDKLVVIPYSLLNNLVKQSNNEIELETILSGYVKKKTCLTKKKVRIVTKYVFKYLCIASNN